MRIVIFCFLGMILSEVGIICGFALGASLEEILVGVLVLLAVCLFYLQIAGGRGSRK